MVVVEKKENNQIHRAFLVQSLLQVRQRNNRNGVSLLIELFFKLFLLLDILDFRALIACAFAEVKSHEIDDEFGKPVQIERACTLDLVAVFELFYQ